MFKFLEPNSNNGAETEKKGQEKTHQPDGERALKWTNKLWQFMQNQTQPQRQCSAKKKNQNGKERKLQSLEEIINGVQNSNE